MDEHQKWLQYAIDLAEKGMHNGDGGPFGCVIVRDGEMVAEGWNRVLSTPDPTAHAEMETIRAAAKALDSFDLSGCILYSSCEPCPMCLAASMWARVDKVYYAGSRQDAADIGFDDASFYEQLSLPIKQRDLPMEQVLPQQGRQVLQKWLDLEARKPY